MDYDLKQIPGPVEAEKDFCSFLLSSLSFARPTLSLAPRKLQSLGVTPFLV